MNLLPRWLQRRPAAPAASLEAVLNAGTWASTEDLVALQRHAAKVELRQAGPARARMGGDRLSRMRGRGMDYQESRDYQPGDDVRSMDWRLTARTGKPHVKIFQEERERPVVLFVDLNPGMFFGSRGMLKSVAASRAAALIAWAAAERGDRVGAMLFNGGHHDLEPRGGKHGVLQLIRLLVKQTDPRQGVEGLADPAGLNGALSRLRRVARPGSLVVLIGDYYAIDEDSAKHLMRLRQHNDVVAIQVVDPLEEAAPPGDRYGITDGGWRGVLDTRTVAARRDYQEFFGRHHRAVAAVMRRQAIPLLRLSTADDLVGCLRSFFAGANSVAPDDAPAAMTAAPAPKPSNVVPA